MKLFGICYSNRDDREIDLEVDIFNVCLHAHGLYWSLTCIILDLCRLFDIDKMTF